MFNIFRCFLLLLTAVLLVGKTAICNADMGATAAAQAAANAQRTAQQAALEAAQRAAQLGQEQNQTNATIAATPTPTPTPTRKPSAPNQNGSQEGVYNESSSGSQEAKSKGIESILQGGVSIAGGRALMLSKDPGSQAAGMAMIAMGVFQIAQGTKGLQGAKELSQNADTASQQFDSLNSMLSPLNGGTTNGSSSSLTPGNLTSGSNAKLMAKLQKETGITPSALTDAINSGLDTTDLLKQFKDNFKLTDGQIASNVAAAQAKLAADGGALNGSTAGASKGTAVDLNAGGLDTTTGASYSGGGGGVKGSGDNGKSLEDILNSFKQDGEDKDGVDSLNAKLNNLSPEVKNSLAKNGITDKSIFAMVRDQYDKNSFMMFGQENKEDTATVILPDGPGPNDGRLPASLPKNF